MTVFVDTSALFAVLDAGDACHMKAAQAWRKLVTDAIPLLTSCYVLVETHALVQHRLGMAAVRALSANLLPLIEVHWIAEDLHARAVSSLLLLDRKRVSLVDVSSFEIMRQRGISRCFSYDRHFDQQGFVRFVA